MSEYQWKQVNGYGMRWWLVAPDGRIVSEIAKMPDGSYLRNGYRYATFEDAKGAP